MKKDLIKIHKPSHKKHLYNFQKHPKKITKEIISFLIKNFHHYFFS
jgi:hypothetical protein